MKNYTVVSGDTIWKIVRNQYMGTIPIWTETLGDCLVRYISLLNGKNLSLYDGVDLHVAADPDSLKVNQVLIIPESIAEAAADPLFKTINDGACYALFNTSDTFTPAKKDNKYLWWIGGGLIALGAIYFLTKKKKGKRR
jgi:LysM domain